jgi:addiction module HigA family antidote
MANIIKKNLHPGTVLQNEFLDKLGISAYKMATDIGVSRSRLSLIIKGFNSISPDTAHRLAKFFGNKAEFWMNLQIKFELDNELGKNAKVYSAIKPFKK